MVTSSISSTLSSLFAPAAAVVIFVPWLVRFPLLAFSALCLSLIVGQLWRLPLFGQGGGLLFSDLASLLVILSAAVLAMRARPPLRSRLPLRLALLFSFFLIITLLPYLWTITSLTTIELLISFSYWCRLSANLFLLPALLILLSDKPDRYRFLFIAVIISLMVLGFLQSIIFPNLSFLVDRGWDPHQGRLVSTWLDPNFIGAFFVLSFFWLSGQIFKQRPYSLGLGLLGAAVLIALFLTKSRSSYLALIITLALVSPLLLSRSRSTWPRLPWFFLFALTLVSLLLVAAFLLAPDRWLGLLTLDDTVQLRAAALREAWHIVPRHPWFGVGYNAYQFFAWRDQLIGNFSIHSRAGTDNSWLTLWLTSGLIGLMAYLIPWLYLANQFLRRWLRLAEWPALGALGAMIALFIHAFFVNSWLYSHLLIVLVIIISFAFTGTSRQPLPSSRLDQASSP